MAGLTRTCSEAGGMRSVECEQGLHRGEALERPQTRPNMIPSHSSRHKHAGLRVAPHLSGPAPLALSKCSRNNILPFPAHQPVDEVGRSCGHGEGQEAAKGFPQEVHRARRRRGAHLRLQLAHHQADHVGKGGVVGAGGEQVPHVKHGEQGGELAGGRHAGAVDAGEVDQEGEGDRVAGHGAGWEGAGEAWGDMVPLLWHAQAGDGECGGIGGVLDGRLADCHAARGA